MGKGTQEIIDADLECSFSLRSSVLIIPYELRHYGKPGREAVMGKPRRVIRGET